MPRAGAARAAGSWCLLALLPGCAERAAQPQAAAACALLEQTFLARLGGGSGGWLLVGRFELRREEYLGGAGDGARDLPMTRISWREFEAWAAPRGLRGPTVEEWRAVAGAPAAAAEAATLTRNTLELGLGRALPVGVFERGRSPLGGYDFYGNVWELTAPDASGRLQALGGSFAVREVGADPRDTLALEAGDRAEDVGVRYVADALPYFRERVLAEWRAEPAATEAVLRRAAARWQPNLRASLARALLAEGLPFAICAAVGD